MKKEILANLLKDEYIMLQQFYEDIDQKALNIKGWSITVATTSFGAALVYDKKEAYLISVVAGVLFWYLESYWRGLSYFFSRRIIEIEAGIREGKWKEMLPLQVYSVWEREYKESGNKTIRYMFKFPTALPHALIVISALVLYFVL
ncbi:hypothetical protein KQH61_05405 [bacterium]|nr:hypothetical protein [bacterium]MCB2179338.1 hypothetical protein [bacterium]